MIAKKVCKLLIKSNFFADFKRFFFVWQQFCFASGRFNSTFRDQKFTRRDRICPPPTEPNLALAVSIKLSSHIMYVFLQAMRDLIESFPYVGNNIFAKRLLKMTPPPPVVNTINNLQ